MAIEFQEEAFASLKPLVARVRTDRTGARSKTGSVWTRTALTDAVLAQHLNGGPARGACPIKAGESVTLVAVLDLDSHKGESTWSEMAACAARITAELERRGMRVFAFRSTGGRGVHLYLIWDEPQEARAVRAFLSDSLAALGLRNGTKGIAAGQVEIFPKQDEVPNDGLGNYFILPLAGASVPLEPLLGFEPLTRADVVQWAASPPVPPIEAPAARAMAEPLTADLAVIRSALAAIPNDGGDGSPDYDEFRNLLFAVHQGTDGGDDGWSLILEFAERSPRHNIEDLEKYWQGAKLTRADGITVRSLFAKAREHGWTDISADEFDVVAPAPDATPLPAFKRNKTGQIEATISNVLLALRRPDVCSVHIGHDGFNDDLMLAAAGTEQWRLFTDVDYTQLRDHLARRGFREIGRETMRDCVAKVGHENAFDSAQLWLRRLPAHDGAERVETFMARYLGAEDTPYTRAVSRYLWTALAGRVLDPGCQADMAPIWTGKQGEKKTSTVAALVPDPAHFVEINLAHRDDNLARSLRGKLVGELGELRGLAGRESEDIKAWVSRRYEEWVPKYKEFAVKFPRRLVFIGTTNADEFLVDTTGNRRWLPVRVGTADLEAILRDRDQLWAEARDLFDLVGVDWQDAERLAAPVHAEHMVSDSWAGAVERWLDEPALDGTKPRSCKFLRIGEVLQGALGKNPGEVERRDELRMGNVLRALGYERGKVRADGRVFWAYRVPLVPLLEGAR